MPEGEAFLRGDNLVCLCRLGPHAIDKDNFLFVFEAEDAVAASPQSALLAAGQAGGTRDGNRESAVALWEESLEIFRELGDRKREAVALRGLAGGAPSFRRARVRRKTSRSST